MEETVLAGVGTALVQSGLLIEPRTAAFVAEFNSNFGNSASYHDAICQLTLNLGY